MDPFHVVRLADQALDRCRRRVQQPLHGRQSRKNDPFRRTRRTLPTGADLLTDKPTARIGALFANEDYTAVEAPGACTSA
jgi:transposase